MISIYEELIVEKQLDINIKEYYDECVKELMGILKINKDISYSKQKIYEIYNKIIDEESISAIEEFKLLKEKSKYNDLINDSSGKVLKIEEWGLLNLARKIKRYNKGFYIHYKFEGNKNTLSEINKKVKIDGSIIRHLIVRYKNLDTTSEYFKKENK